MANELTVITEQAATPTVSLTHLSGPERVALPIVFSAFIDTAATATARATFYNTQAEQEQAVRVVHDRLFTMDRGIYGAALLLPGVTDRTRQLGVMRLLSASNDGPTLLSEEQEKAIVQNICAQLPPQRMLKLFGQLRAGKVNNARTRKLILRSILTSPHLEFWAVKYRRKVAAALQHAWGRRTTSILGSILAKPAAGRNDKEQNIVTRHIGRFLNEKAKREHVEQCVRFVLGQEDGLTLPRLSAYHRAKNELTEGSRLPYEVLEGIRSRFHRDVRSGRVLALTKAQLTVGQKMTLQRKAKQADVEVEFDPACYDPVRLYLYAFEMGMTDAIREQLRCKAQQVADRLAVRFRHAAVLLDSSASMVGHDTQKRRPIAVALAMRDVLSAVADKATVVTNDGRNAAMCELIQPAGDTSLAPALVELLRARPDVVFLLSDGYENAPAGRVADVVGAVRRLGIETPIHHFSPVFGAESLGVRQLSEQIPAMPVSKPEAIGLGLLKALFASDVERGVAALLSMTLPKLEKRTEFSRIVKETVAQPSRLPGM